MITELSRRTIVTSGLASFSLLSLMPLSGCANGGFSLVEAIRRLLSLSSQRAFASLLRENGFFDDAISRISLPDSLGGDRASSLVAAALRSGPVRERMLRQVNRAAEKGAELAAPMVAEAIRTVSIADAVAIVRGGPSAATEMLKGQMGAALVTAMVPGIENGLRLFDSQIVSDALRLATGIDFARLRNDVTAKTSDAIYRAIAHEEAGIRADPQSANDPLLATVFGIGKKL
jgi:Protein of unknown function (DUF4197)